MHCAESAMYGDDPSTGQSLFPFLFTVLKSVNRAFIREFSASERDAI